MFRTFASDWLSNGRSEGDLVHGGPLQADMADQRARDAERRMGDMY